MPSDAELRPCPNPGCADSDDLIPFGNMRVTCNNCHLDTTRDVWQALPRPGEERAAVVDEEVLRFLQRIADPITRGKSRRGHPSITFRADVAEWAQRIRARLAPEAEGEAQ